MIKLFKNLKKIINMNDKALFKYLLKKIIKTKKVYYTDYCNYIFIVGSSPHCYVAHIDTRVKNRKNMKIIETKNIIYNKNGVLKYLFCLIACK